MLYDCFGKQLASHLHVDLQHGLDTFFPGLSRARQSAIEIVQEADETIFVPSNWFHTVENLQDTLSINHNWLNGANIRHCWRHVESEMRSLRQGKHEFAFPVDSRIYLTATITDYSQLEEDVLLLWHVVSKKAKSIIDSAHKEGITVRIRSDLDGILFILQGLLALVHNGSKSVLTSRSDCNVAELQSVVAGFLTTPEKDSID